MAASYPSSIKSFTTKTNTSTADASHINDVQLEVTAIETDLLTAFPGGGADGGQMVFPATQNPSTDANTLDDYEEGSWTPTITGTGGGSGQTYGVQVGRYVKVGRLVVCTFRITLTALGTVTTAAQIAGLPFTVDNVTNGQGSMQVGWWSNTTSSFVFMTGLTQVNTTTINLYGATAAATTLTAIVQGDLSNTFDIIGTVSYRASA